MSVKKQLVVTYVRSTAGRAGTRLQEWRSKSTGRIFEVPEHNSYAAAVDLMPGAPGFLYFLGGRPRVAETEAQQEYLKTQRYPKRSKSQRAGTKRKKTLIPQQQLWLLPAILLVLIVWQLLRVIR